MLRVDRLVAGYAGGTVLDGLSLHLTAGTVQALVGRNGAGKTTLVHVLAGLLRPYGGQVAIGGRQVTGWPAHRIARAGVGLVPQGRRVFSSLTVAEHLSIASAAGRRQLRAAPTPAVSWTTAALLDRLPRLGERLGHRGDQLSGGEQQMLAIARALLTQPRVLLLDEPREGLSPDLADRMLDLVGQIARQGVAVLLVEQNQQPAARVTDQVALLEAGRIVPQPQLSPLVASHPGGDVVGHPDR